MQYHSYIELYMNKRFKLYRFFKINISIEKHVEQLEKSIFVLASPFLARWHYS